MSPALEEIQPELYARTVLPLTASLWANGRAYDTYVSQTLALARTAYGKRHYRTLGMRALDGTIAASFKRYERTALLGNAKLRAIGLGAVFTRPESRGQGLASAMCAMALDQGRAEGCDFAYLFSDIHPQFYAAIGFVQAPSRIFSIRADALPPQRLRTAALRVAEWRAVRRIFNSVARRMECALERTPLVWHWIETRIAHGSEHARGQAVNLAVESDRGVEAYVIGQREPQHDAYVMDECGFADEAATQYIPPLLRQAAGDLRRVTGWLPPAPVRRALPLGSVRRRKSAIWMIAPLSRAGRKFLECVLCSPSDVIWSSDHI